MLRRLRSAPWRGVPRSRSAAGSRRLASCATPPRPPPLAHTLTEAARHPLTSKKAQTLCASALQDTPVECASLPADGVHARTVQSVLRMKSGSVNRDVLLSELLRAVWAADAELPAELLVQVAASCGVRGLQRTRALLHRRLLAHAPDDGERVWRAMLDAHALRHDWARVEHGLAACAAQGTPLPLDTYRYTLLRLQHESPNELPAALHHVLLQMRQDERLLNDALLAELVYALGAPVRHAQASRVRGAQLVRIAAPVHALIDGLFLWLSAREGAERAQYRSSLSTLLHVQLDTVEALYDAQVYRARALHVPRRHTGAIRRRLSQVRAALEGPDGLLESVDIRLDGVCGEMDAALSGLTAWLSSAPPSRTLAQRQRRTVLALFATGSRLPRPQRLSVLLQLLCISTVYGSAAQLWHGVAGRTLPRLWARLFAVWAHGTRSTLHRIEAASTQAGWPFLVAAFPVLLDAAQRTRHLPRRAWSAVLDDPHRCRAMVWAACSAQPRADAETRMRMLQHYFQRLHAPPRVMRWAQATQHDAAVELPPTP